MKRLTKYILYMFIGGLLSFMGYSALNWQVYAILFSILGVDILSAMIAVESLGGSR